MGKTSAAKANGNTKAPPRASRGRNLNRPDAESLADAGIMTSRDFRNVMGALLGDVIAGRIDPATANAACNAGGKLLKMVEMEFQYGRPERSAGMLQLSAGES